MKHLIENMDLRTALLMQDYKSQELKAAHQHSRDFFDRAVKRIFELPDRDRIRKEINNLVDIANRYPESSIKFDIYDSLNEYHAEHIQGNDAVDPYVAYHVSSILSSDPFITGGGIPVINGQLANCTDFDFILDQRREKIKKLRNSN